MSKRCQITGKRGLAGNRVSHAKNRSRHVQQLNLHKKRVWVEEKKRWVTVRISSQGLRILQRKGAFQTLKEAGLID